LPSLTQDPRFGSQADQQTDKESNPHGYNSIGTKYVDYGLGANPNLAPDGTRFYKNVPGDISEFRGLKAHSLRGTSSYSSFSRVVRFAAELHRLNAIGNPLEKKIQPTRAQGFPDSVFTDLWRLLPDRVVRSFQQRQVSQMDNA
jgi:hypothetical protein